ncbi:MAG: hypothetical protein OXC30_01895 [Alphaproteobacteria bacterium]|nr:hypothetical protein [Alphaproteobacteria bacterium]
MKNTFLRFFLFCAIVASTVLVCNVRKEQKAQKIEIYGYNWCTWCVKAKELLRNKGIDFEYHDLEGASEQLKEKAFSGLHLNQTRTVPQIFLNNSYIGGMANLERAVQSGKIKRSNKAVCV